MNPNKPQEKTRQEKARQGKTRQDTRRKDSTRDESRREDNRRQDKTRQDKTRQAKKRQRKEKRRYKTRDDKTRHKRTRDKTRQEQTRAETRPRKRPQVPKLQYHIFKITRREAKGRRREDREETKTPNNTKAERLRGRCHPVDGLPPVPSLGPLAASNVDSSKV